jgi:hypothetical protein
MNSIKKLKNIAVAGGLFLLTAWVNTSCDTTNDWSVDESYDRLFRTTSISVVPTATEAGVTCGMGPSSKVRYTVFLSPGIRQIVSGNNMR